MRLLRRGLALAVHLFEEIVTRQVSYQERRLREEEIALEVELCRAASLAKGDVSVRMRLFPNGMIVPIVKVSQILDAAQRAEVDQVLNTLNPVRPNTRAWSTLQ